MTAALEEAQAAFDAGEVPVGAVVVRADCIIARERNRMEETGDPTAHAEMLAIRAAVGALGASRLTGCDLYVTLEPCPMCAGGMIMARLERCYFGARDPRQGCGESVYALTQDPSFYHRLPCVGGLMENEAARLLARFFREKRGPGAAAFPFPRDNPRDKETRA